MKQSDFTGELQHWCHPIIATKGTEYDKCFKHDILTERRRLRPLCCRNFLPFSANTHLILYSHYELVWLWFSYVTSTICTLISQRSAVSGGMWGTRPVTLRSRTSPRGQKSKWGLWHFSTKCILNVCFVARRSVQSPETSHLIITVVSSARCRPLE